MPLKLRQFLPVLLALAMTPGLRAAEPGKTAAPEPAPIPQFYIGVAVEAIPPLMAAQLKLRADQGLNVQRVIPNSPAEAAHLQPGDLLIAINDEPLLKQQQLVDATRPEETGGRYLGRSLTLDYLRNGEHRTATLTPAPRPPTLVASGSPAAINGAANNKTYAGANGTLRIVGTGYIIDTLNNNAQLAKSIRALTVGGETVILSQESDATGHVKTTVTIGNVTTVVDPAHLEALPADLREVVRPLVAEQAGPVDSQLELLQKKLREQQQEIQELKDKLNELLQQKKP